MQIAGTVLYACLHPEHQEMKAVAHLGDLIAMIRFYCDQAGTVAESGEAMFPPDMLFNIEGDIPVMKWTTTN
jgi:hypothetical protein